MTKTNELYQLSNGKLKLQFDDFYHREIEIERIEGVRLNEVSVSTLNTGTELFLMILSGFIPFIILNAIASENCIWWFEKSYQIEIHLRNREIIVLKQYSESQKDLAMKIHYELKKGLLG